MCYYVPLRSGSEKISPTRPTTTFGVAPAPASRTTRNMATAFISDPARGPLYVTLFIASELNWKDAGIKVRLETPYPDESATKLTASPCDQSKLSSSQFASSLLDRGPLRSARQRRKAGPCQRAGLLGRAGSRVENRRLGGDFHALQLAHRIFQGQASIAFAFLEWPAGSRAAPRRYQENRFPSSSPVKVGAGQSQARGQ